MQRDTTRLTPAALQAALRGDMHNFLVAATPGGIEAQEAAGQAILAADSNLPADMMGDRAHFEAMGIVFGKKVDDIFITATLPPGWKKVPTSHSMWSDLVDDKGRKRASIFYKAAFYDRNAHMRSCCRFSVNTYVPCDATGAAMYSERATHYACIVEDGGKEIHRSGVRESRDYDGGYDLAKACAAWLDKQYPKWQSPVAYWD